MLVIPLTGNISWRNPPYMTILFIAINCFIYFGFQLGDDNGYVEAVSYYIESDLVHIEKDYYTKYLQESSRPAEAKEIQALALNSQEAKIRVFKMLHQDGPFNRKLDGGELITPDDPQYAQWHKQRTIFQDKLSDVVSWRFGIRPAQQNIISYCAHMFLHGSVMHLVGNMVFLWFVGCLIEIGAGRLTFTLGYIATGLFAGALFSILHINSNVPLVGASGAISGLMGMYTILYATKKVDVFYSLGFFFNKKRIPAFILLPFWLGKELFQFYFGGPSQVAYAAHIGGLVSGTFLGYGHLKYLGGLKEDLFAEPTDQKIAGLLEKGLQAVAQLDFESAGKHMHSVLELDPNNQPAIIHLFNIEKVAPDSENFHKAATRALNALSIEKSSYDTMAKIYNEYKKLATPPRLSPGLCAQLSIRFAENGSVDESSRILALLIKKNQNLSMVPSGLLTLARAYFKKSMSDKGKNCLNILCTRYPDAPESQTALTMLNEAQ